MKPLGTPFDEFEIIATHAMVGDKGLADGHRLYVSPKFLALCRAATPDELTALLCSLRVIGLPDVAPPMFPHF